MTITALIAAHWALEEGQVELSILTVPPGKRVPFCAPSTQRLAACTVVWGIEWAIFQDLADFPGTFPRRAVAPAVHRTCDIFARVRLSPCPRGSPSPSALSFFHPGVGLTSLFP